MQINHLTNNTHFTPPSKAGALGATRLTSPANTQRVGNSALAKKLVSFVLLFLKDGSLRDQEEIPPFFLEFVQIRNFNAVVKPLFKLLSTEQGYKFLLALEEKAIATLQNRYLDDEGRAKLPRLVLEFKRELSGLFENYPRNFRI